MTAARPMGPTATRFERVDGVDSVALLAALRGLAGVIDAVVTDRHVLLSHAPRACPLDDLEPVLRGLMPPRAGAHHRFEVVYDGADLSEVATLAGLSIGDVIARHASGSYRVELMGFQVGFAYLGGLDPRLHLPRRGSPRPRVPAQSVAIAGARTAVYPFASPGGWHLLGRLDAGRLFDALGAPLLKPGDTVSFTVAGAP